MRSANRSGWRHGFRHASVDDPRSSLDRRDAGRSRFTGDRGSESVSFRHQSRSIAAKRGLLSVILTVSRHDAFRESL